MPAGLTPRTRATKGEGTMRCFAAILFFARSMRSIRSLLPFDTKSASPCVARKLGALPPTVLPLSEGAPTNRPVFKRLMTFGAAGFATRLDRAGVAGPGHQAAQRDDVIRAGDLAGGEVGLRFEGGGRSEQAHVERGVAALRVLVQLYREHVLARLED